MKKLKAYQNAERLKKLESMTLEDIKKEQEKQQFLAAASLFEGVDEIKHEAQNMADRIADYEPKTKDDFAVFAQILADRLKPYEQHMYFVPFLENFLELVTDELTTDDMSALKKKLNVLTNDKIKKTAGKSKSMFVCLLLIL